MQTSVSMSTESKVPPGFRFHPTDEELVDYYLKKKVDSQRIDLDVIREINLYKIEPWDLQETCRIGSTDQDEWYFFSHKDKKYPTGTRTNRATAAGFWKATGRDKAIYSKHKLVGMRKTLVFYRGRAPNGQKTDWIMHEYRLENCENGCTSQTSEEGWAVCRVFRKRSPNIKRMHEGDPASCCYDEQMSLLAEFDSPKHGLHDDLLYHQPFSCKQELDQFVEYHLSHDPFLQLPQLESPKITCFASTSNVRSMIMENTRRNEYHIPNFCTMDAVSFEMNTDQLTSSAATPGTIPSNTATLNKEEQVMDWRVLDRLVASQLSQEDTPKEIRFPSSVVACLGQQNKQQITTAPNYNPNNDIDLWSLAKRDFSSR